MPNQRMGLRSLQTIRENGFFTAMYWNTTLAVSAHWLTLADEDARKSNRLFVHIACT